MFIVVFLFTVSIFPLTHTNTTQDDLITSMNLIFEGYTLDLAHAFEGATFYKWLLAVVAYFLEGGLGLVVTFLLVAISNDGEF